MVINEYLVDDLKKLGLWSEDMLERIKYYDGSIQQIQEIPPAIRDKYKETFEIEAQWLIKAAAYRGRWIDQSQSLNIFYGGSSGRVLSEIYQYAWSLGLKTTYYLRTLGASRVEKATVNLAKFGGTSHGDTGVALASGMSSTIIEEGVVMAAISSPVALESDTLIEAEIEEVPDPIRISAVYPTSLAEIETQLRAQLSRAEPKIEILSDTCQPAAKSGSSGIPTFSAPTALGGVDQAKRNIEIIGEDCESCSA